MINFIKRNILDIIWTIIFTILVAGLIYLTSKEHKDQSIINKSLVKLWTVNEKDFVPYHPHATNTQNCPWDDTTNVQVIPWTNVTDITKIKHHLTQTCVPSTLHRIFTNYSEEKLECMCETDDSGTYVTNMIKVWNQLSTNKLVTIYSTFDILEEIDREILLILTNNAKLYDNNKEKDIDTKYCDNILSNIDKSIPSIDVTNNCFEDKLHPFVPYDKTYLWVGKVEGIGHVALVKFFPDHIIISNGQIVPYTETYYIMTMKYRDFFDNTYEILDAPELKNISFYY